VACALCLQVSAASTYSTREVRALSREQRQCLFEDEQSLGNSGADADVDAGSYSYSNCLMRCRMDHMNKLCQCAPYFYPTGGAPSGGGRSEVTASLTITRTQNVSNYCIFLLCPSSGVPKQWYSTHLCSCTPRCDLLSTLCPQTCWCIIKVIHSL
jgi:hypothetical protein